VVAELGLEHNQDRGGALRDEAALLLLIVAGTIVYAGSILLLFGRGWLRSLVR